MTDFKKECSKRLYDSLVEILFIIDNLKSMDTSIINKKIDNNEVNYEIKNIYNRLEDVRENLIQECKKEKDDPSLQTLQTAGKKGGKNTLKKYGKEHFVAMAKKRWGGKGG